MSVGPILWNGVVSAPTISTATSGVVAALYVLASTDPTALDDVNDGYIVGQRWINTAANKTFTLTNATAGAAVWVEEDGSGGGGGGTGDVVGPSSSTADDIAIFNGATGKVIKDSGVKIPAGGIADAAYDALPSCTGILSGGLLTVNVDNTKFDISAGSGYIIDNWTNPAAPVKTTVVWSAKTAVVDNYRTSDPATTILIDSTGSVVQKNVPPDENDYRDYIVIGKTIHTNKTAIVGTASFQHSLASSDLFTMDLASFIGVMARGVEITANGANLNINRSSGTMYRCGSNYVTTQKLPNIATVASATALSFQYRYRDGSGGFKVDTATASVNPAIYDNGSGTLADPGPNKFTIQRVYVFTNGNTFIVPGQTVYNSLDIAKAAIQTELPVVDPQLKDACLRAYICIRRGTSSLQNAADAYFQTGGLFGTVLAGGTATAAILDQRTSVNDADYTATSDDRYVGYTAITAPRTVTLPAANSVPGGHAITIGDESGQCWYVFYIAITPNGSDTVNLLTGAGAAVMRFPFSRYTLVSDGATNWTCSGIPQVGETVVQTNGRRDLLAWETELNFAVNPTAASVQCGMSHQQNGGNIVIDSTAADYAGFRIGIANMNYGTALTDRVRMEYSPGNWGYFGAGFAACFFDMLLGVLPTSTADYVIREVGWTDSTTAGTSAAPAANAVCFVEDYNTSTTYLQIMTAKASSRTRVILDGTANAPYPAVTLASLQSTIQRWAISVNAAGTSCSFYINGTLVAVSTTNIPNGTANLVGFKSAYWRQGTLAGAPLNSANSCKTDRIGWFTIMTTPRSLV